MKKITVTIKGIDKDLWTLIRVSAIEKNITVAETINQIISEHYNDNSNK
ncbi:MAG: hypothetical protein SWO11_22835 [Thermodesulfobacteriota bacterium]|jgi:hypothetical protein|nr:hypothetical protein [Thermodesulfobacteriota bacterium]